MLKPYMYFSRSRGSEEGASLIFAHTAKEAKKVAWKEIGNLFVYDWTDIGVRLLKNEDYLFKEANQDKLANDIPHSKENPICCNGCEMWGNEIGEDGYCEGCRDDLPLDI
jgi:hypothetical protein